MTSVQIDKVDMYRVVINNLNNQPPATLQSIPNFNQLFDEFKAKVEELSDKSVQQSANGTGIRMDKLEKKDDMITLALNTANCVRAYASSIDDFKLGLDMTFTRTKLMRLREVAVADTCNFIYKKALENSAQLIAYGITEVVLDGFENAMSEYNKSITQPRVNINKRKLTTQNIKQLIEDCNAILAQMDILVSILKLTNLSFVTSYIFSRKTIHRHGSKLAIRGIITTEEGAPLEGAKIKIAKIKKPAFTSSKGYFEFKNLPAGFHKITISRVGYITIEEQVGTIKRMRLQLNRTMQMVLGEESVA
jgi:hypothetical protein